MPNGHLSDLYEICQEERQRLEKEYRMIQEYYEDMEFSEIQRLQTENAKLRAALKDAPMPTAVQESLKAYSVWFDDTRDPALGYIHSAEALKGE